MKNIKNILFYVIVIGGFSFLMYLIVKGGQAQETISVKNVQSPTDTIGLEQIKNTLHHNITDPLGILILQIISIIIAARIFGFLLKKIGQPSVIGEIIAGIV